MRKKRLVLFLWSGFLLCLLVLTRIFALDVKLLVFVLNWGEGGGGGVGFTLIWVSVAEFVENI